MPRLPRCFLISSRSPLPYSVSLFGIFFSLPAPRRDRGARYQWQAQAAAHLSQGAKLFLLHFVQLLLRASALSSRSRCRWPEKRLPFWSKIAAPGRSQVPQLGGEAELRARSLSRFPGWPGEATCSSAGTGLPPPLRFWAVFCCRSEEASGLGDAAGAGPPGAGGGGASASPPPGRPPEQRRSGS